MTSISLIIFDFDGTLGDTRQNIVTTMRQTLEQLGLPERSEEACAATIGLPLKECFRSLMPELGEQILDDCATTYRVLFEQNKSIYRIKPFPHVVETLEELRSQGYKMGIATSRGLPSLIEFLDDLGIAHCFDCLLGADSVIRHKPDPEPVLTTLRKLNKRPEDALVVGDMPVDILMGKGAGCLSCAVSYGNASREDLKQAGADYIIDDFSELNDILCHSGNVI